MTHSGFSLPNILITISFLLSAYQDIKNRKETIKMFSDNNFPAPELAFMLWEGWKIVFSLGLLITPFMGLSAWALVLLMVISMVLFRNFWKHTGKARETNFRFFVLDLAIVGGLLLAA